MKPVLKVLFAIYGLFISMTTSLAAYPTRAVLPSLNANTGVDEFWDFFGGITDTPFTTSNSGSGQVVGNFYPGSTHYPGSITMSAGALNDEAVFQTALLFENSLTLHFQTRAVVDHLVTGAQQFKLKFGISDVFTFTGSESFSTLFIYDSTLSSNWICRTYSSALGVTDTFTTTVPVDTGDHYYAIYHTPTSVSYYIDNVLVRAYPIAIGTSEVGRLGGILRKTVATGFSPPPGYITFDAVKFQQTFATPRSFQP